MRKFYDFRRQLNFKPRLCYNQVNIKIKIFEAMRIKISPKKAVKLIDDLAEEGERIRSEIFEDYDIEYEKGEKEWLESDAIVSLGTVHHSRVSEKSFLKYESKQQKWVEKCEETLNEIFLDFIPVNIFFSKYTPADLKAISPDTIRFNKIIDSIDNKVEVLTDFYLELQKNIKVPLIYLEDKSQIWFYDIVCQLKPNTNESELCGYMFEFGIGEWKNFDEIYAHLMGENVENILNWPKNWKSKIVSAYDGVNRKTNDIFNFNVFKKQANNSLLATNFPARLVGS